MNQFNLTPLLGGLYPLASADYFLITAMKKNDPPFDNPDIRHLNLYLYVIPVIGFFPALWTLYRRQGSRQEIAASRLAVSLALTWLLATLLLETGGNFSEFLKLPSLIISSVLTSTYFLVSLALMIRIWKRQPLWLPWFSRLGDRIP